jgi:TupA-like ATPgrasp
MPFTIHYPRSRRNVEKPKNLERMLEVARLLSRHFNFVRVDLYSNGEECLVGGITNCPGGASGFVTHLYTNGAKYLPEEITDPRA